MIYTIMLALKYTSQYDLDVKTNELASRRIAFEEEKLLREAAEVQAADGEAESLRRRLRNQVFSNVCHLLVYTTN